MFNLAKYNQLETAPNDVLDDTEELADGLKSDLDQTNINRQFDVKDNPLIDQLQPDEQRISDILASLNALQVMNGIIDSYPPGLRGALESTPAFQKAQRASANFNPGSYGFNDSPDKKAQYSRLEELAKSNPHFVQTIEQFKTEAQEVSRLQQEVAEQKEQQRNLGILGSKIEWKQAQNSNFPVQDAADLATKFLRRLVTNNPNDYAMAAQEILTAVRGEIQEEEINSMLESLRSLDYDSDQSQAMSILGQMFDILPTKLKTSTDIPAQVENHVMSKNNPKGIIKFNLSDHIINNKTSESDNIVGLVKTAADHFGQEYLLYGPTEKRICPKLRGRGGGQPGSGDVVSEYVCRHHCLDGIVIDDNKTICGEALWRANLMDKYSREYVDKEGNIQGGYLNKRFHIERNVPEENKMRLKPGETRKPRPPAWGNMESRLQDMRQRQADKRGYRPDSNTGDPFKWCTDVDQNNVEQSQSERDQREKASGHQTVQYTNKLKQENMSKQASYKTAKERWIQDAVKKPGSFTEYCGGQVTDECIEEGKDSSNKKTKQRAELAETFREMNHGKKSFNLKRYKTAEKCPCGCGKEKGKCGCHDNPADTGEAYSTMLNRRFREKSKESFNLKKHKTAQLAPVPVPADGARTDRFIDDPKKRKPMLGPETHQDRHPDISSPEQPNEDESVMVPGGDIVDKDEAEKRHLKDLGQELMDYNGGMFTSVYRVSSSWATGNDVPPELVSAAYQELEDAINPEKVNYPETITDDMVRDVKQLQEKLLPYMNTESDESDMRISLNNAWWMKEAKEKKEKGVTYKGEHFKYNPWSVCNKSTGGKNEAGEEKFERCVRHVKDQSRDKESQIDTNHLSRTSKKKR